MSNTFSKSIKFHPGASTPLLNYMGSENAVLLEEKALRILRNIEEPIAVIAVVGSYRRGKSYFANTLHGHHDGFKLGSSVEGCTKGIDMWDTPFLHEGKRVVIFDCEGIDDPNQEVPWASKLFILCLAISSTFVFNINGVIGRDDVGKLCLMTDIASHIKAPTDSKFSPNLVVLLRDFQFDNPPDFVEYFFDKLSRVNDGAAKGVKDFFGEFKVHAIPSPGIHRDQMKNMGTIKTDQLDPLFVKSIENVVDNIFKDLPPKYIEKSTMSGLTFVKFLEDCVAQMNDPENKAPLSIPSVYEVTTHYVAQKAHETCIKNYEDIMTTRTNNKLPIPWDEFDKIHIESFEISSKDFVKMIIGSAKQIQSFQKKFYEKILDLKKQFYQKNSEAVYKHNNEWAHNLWKEHVMHGLKKTNPFTPEEYMGAIDFFEQVYGTIAIPGQEAGKVLNEFKDHQYKDAIETLKSCNALHEAIAEGISSRQKAEQKYYELVQEEGRLQKEISNYTNEEEKIQKQLEEKMKNLEECFRNQEPNNQEAILRLRKENEQMLAKVKEENQLRIELLKQKLDKAKESKNNFWSKTKTIIGVVSAVISLASLLFGVPLPI